MGICNARSSASGFIRVHLCPFVVSHSKFNATMTDESKPSSPNPQQQPEELAHYDDAVIGRAFRWSVIAALLLVSTGAIFYFFLHRKPATEPAKLSRIVPPALSAAPAKEIPIARFTDITTSSGIAFTHVNGAYGEKLMLETMGGVGGFFY